MEDPGLVTVSIPRHDPLPLRYVTLFTFCSRATLAGGIILTLLFSKQFVSIFVEVIAGTGPIVNEDDIPFNTEQHVFRYGVCANEGYSNA